MFVKTSLRDRLDCLIDFVGMILLAGLFLLPCLGSCFPAGLSAFSFGSFLRLSSPSPNYFLRVCFPTPFAADLKDFLPLITSPISGSANSNRSAPTRFAAGTIYLHRNGIAVLPITCASAPNHLPLCLPTAL